MQIIVGLGNPGEKYIGTRHNLGFAVLDKLGDRLQGTGYRWENSKKFKSYILRYSQDDRQEMILVKPQTYMNNSGMAVSAVANFYQIDPKDIIIIHDDLDLLLGKIKVRQGGAAGGHHGVESIISAIGDQFIRVRLGIGNDRSHLGEHHRVSFNAEKFVVDQFLPTEISKVKSMLKEANKALDLLLEKGLEVAQTQFN